MSVIEKLQMYSSSETVDNIYQEPLKAKNLDVYLTTLQQMRPKAIIVGGAPIYHGGQKTGIPFTDEYNVSEDDTALLKKKDEYGYSILRESVDETFKDRVSGIIWTGLKNDMENILLWNIFPFYAHEKDDYKSARPITVEEGAEGYEFLEMILESFPSLEIILVVGEVPSEIISKHEELKKQYKVFYVGHPNMGAKDEFISRIKTAMKLKENIMLQQEEKQMSEISYEYRKRWADMDTEGHFFCRALNRILDDTQDYYCESCPCNLGAPTYCGYYDFYRPHTNDLPSIVKKNELLIRANLIPLFPDYKIRNDRSELLVEQAFQFAAELYQNRIYIEKTVPYIVHLMQLVYKYYPYIMEVEMDNPEEIVVAIIFYNVLYNTQVPAGKIGKEFGTYVLSLIDEENPMHKTNVQSLCDQMKQSSMGEEEFEEFQKLFRNTVEYN